MVEGLEVIVVDGLAQTVAFFAGGLTYRRHPVASMSCLNDSVVTTSTSVMCVDKNQPNALAGGLRKAQPDHGRSTWLGRIRGDREDRLTTILPRQTPPL